MKWEEGGNSSRLPVTKAGEYVNKNMDLSFNILVRLCIVFLTLILYNR